MWLTSANGKLIVDNKTGKNISVGKDDKSGEFLIYVDYQRRGKDKTVETKAMVHKKFQSEREATDYLAQLCTKLNNADYPTEKILKVFLYNKS